MIAENLFLMNTPQLAARVRRRRFTCFDYRAANLN
jgi:hypothetical protein